MLQADLGALSAQQLKMEAMCVDEWKIFTTTKEDLVQSIAAVQKAVWTLRQYYGTSLVQQPAVPGRHNPSHKHTFPEFVSLRAHFCMHSYTLRRISSMLCHRHIDDHIHMHFHNNPTDTQHTHEGSLGHKTPLRTTQILHGVLLAVRPNYHTPHSRCPPVLKWRRNVFHRNPRCDRE